MELCIKHEHTNEKDVIYESIESNKIIHNGYFIKLSYNHFYNINISSNTLILKNPIKHIYNNKRGSNLKYIYIENNNSNKSFIDFIKQYDLFFEKQTREFLSIKNIRNKSLSYVGMTRKTESNGILFRIPIHEKEHEFKEINNKIILRWNGIWISKTQFGLNYKILSIIPISNNTTKLSHNITDLCKMNNLDNSIIN
jgi:hypothetical protein